jgi:uncharacterized SAM-binding protein YcdF (DUF218 family)
MSRAVGPTTDSADARHVSRVPLRRRQRRALAVLVVVAVLFGATIARFFVSPELPKLPRRADAIIELGGPGNRDGAALNLAREHRAPILIQSTVVAEAGTDECLPPVPDVTIMCFHADPSTTQGEARYIGKLAAQHGWKSVILVTSRDHAWRARLWMTRCFRGDVYVSMTPLPPWAWPWQIAYQWAATLKALLVETEC